MALTPKDIAKMLDHSTLQPWLTEDDIRHGCEVALKYDTASVCARPCDVPILNEMLKGSGVKVCTVIGFPHGAHQTAIKVAEAKQALAEGCEELDMVRGGEDPRLPPEREGRGGLRQDKHGLRQRGLHDRGPETDAGQRFGGCPN